MSEQTTTKRGRGRPPLTPEEKELRKHMPVAPPTKGAYALTNIDPGDNSRYLAHAMAVRNMPVIDTSDPAQVERRIDEYMALCAQFDMKPTVKGFCNALRISRNTLFEWRRGKFRGDTHQAIVLRAYDLLEELWENYMQNGKINPVSGIFLGKNNFDHRRISSFGHAGIRRNHIFLLILITEVILTEEDS